MPAFDWLCNPSLRPIFYKTRCLLVLRRRGGHGSISLVIVFYLTLRGRCRPDPRSDRCRPLGGGGCRAAASALAARGPRKGRRNRGPRRRRSGSPCRPLSPRPQLRPLPRPRLRPRRRRRQARRRGRSYSAGARVLTRVQGAPGRQGARAVGRARRLRAQGAARWSWPKHGGDCWRWRAAGAWCRSWRAACCSCTESFWRRSCAWRTARRALAA